MFSYDTWVNVLLRDIVIREEGMQGETVGFPTI